jgi:dTDP-4-dehydrorhamnose reductase
LRETLVDDELILTDLPELDLGDYQSTREFFLKNRPDMVIHCAAKTQVDECETQPDQAYRGNVLATKNVVNGCQAVDAGLVYISTDYVFDGKNKEPYREYDRCCPNSVYGITKSQGEEIVKAHLSRFYIARTAWLFGDVGQNIVRTVLKLASEHSELRFVNDQFGCPTYAMDLAVAIGKLIRTEAYGIYHITNEGSCSWYEFVKDILEASGNRNTTVLPIPSTELNRPAPRPAFSILAKDGLRNVGIEMPHYHDWLKRFLRKNDLYKMN